MNPDMPWNEEIRASLARVERLAASRTTLGLTQPLSNRTDVRSGPADNSCARPSFFTTPMTL